MELLLSASSCLQNRSDEKPVGYICQFSIHPSNGSLLLNPINDIGLLDSIKYVPHREPESHIEAVLGLASNALQCMNIDCPAAIYGLTDKDISFAVALSVNYKVLYPKIIYPKLHPLEVQNIVSTYSKEVICNSNSIIVIRHLLEHVRNLDRFLAGLRSILNQDTVCFIEVPDSIKLLTQGDLTQLWEEHTVYFTSDTLLRTLHNAGFEILETRQIVSEGEEICIIVTSKNDHLLSYSTEIPQLPACFLNKLPKQILNLQLAIEKAAAMRNVFIFGANHVAGTFLDIIHDTAERISALIDDDPLKYGHSLGLCQLPIITPDELPNDRPLHILVAINEGRAPGLYVRLKCIFSADQGHVVQSLVSFCKQGWEAAQ